MLTGFSNALSALLDLQEAMDRTFNADFFGRSTVFRGGFPSINFFEKNDELVLTAELPGIDKAGLNLEVERDMLRISGERRLTAPEEEGASVHRMERFGGRFSRSLKIPFVVDRDKVSASYENGILTVRLPRHESERARRIAIQ